MSSRLILPRNLEEVAHDQRREPERGLIEQHQPWPEHQGSRHRQHLLLAARQRAGLLDMPLLEDGKVRVHAFDICGDASPAPGDRAKLEVLLDRHGREGAAALWDMGYTETDDIFGRAAG